MTGTKPLKLAVLSTFTCDAFTEDLSARLRSQGMEVETYQAGFNQVHQEIQGAESGWRRFGADATFVLADARDLLADAFNDPWSLDEDAVRARARRASEDFQALLGQALDASAGTLFAFNFTRPPRTPLGPFDGKAPWNPRVPIAILNDALADSAKKSPRLVALDLEGLVLEKGADALSDERMWILARMRWSQGGLGRIAGLAERALRAALVPRKKCLVLDLDGTLWGGVLGQDGENGIIIGSEGIGLAYREFQQVILQLKRRGVLLAINSKNDHHEALEVLSRHPGMALRPNDFASIRINWLSKDENLRSIAQELGLGLDSLVFVDDNPAECGLIAARFPEVLTIHLPEDPSRYRDILVSLPEFDNLSFTAEDSRRAAHYAQRKGREDARAAASSLEDYLASLGTRLRVWEAGAADVARIAQLAQKTNQFNVTGQRYSDAEIQRMTRDPERRVYAAQMTDRFGDEGTICACVVKRADNAWEIDNLVLSCRVIGRGIERAVLARVTQDAFAAGAAKVVGRYLPTARNAPAQNVFRDAGFADESGSFVLKKGARAPQTPRWIEVLE